MQNTQIDLLSERCPSGTLTVIVEGQFPLGPQNPTVVPTIPQITLAHAVALAYAKKTRSQIQDLAAFAKRLVVTSFQPAAGSITVRFA